MNIGFIGLGDMGLPMARKLIPVGDKLLVWNRTRVRADNLLLHGAILAGSPAELMEQCDAICLCVSSHEAVEEIVSGPSGLYSASSFRARVIVDFSTSSVEATTSLAKSASTHGVSWIDAPVSGGVPAAERGELVLFLGGDPIAIADMEPLFAAVSIKATHMGPVGQGQVTKLCNQLIVACSVISIAEAIGLARKTGLNVNELPDVLGGGFADSLPLQLFGPRMASHNFEPRLGAISLMKKDVLLALDLAKRVGANTPILRRVREIYEQVGECSSPAPNEDISALIKLFEETEK